MCIRDSPLPVPAPIKVLTSAAEMPEFKLGVEPLESIAGVPESVAVIVSVSPTTAVLTLVPPVIVNVSLLLSATAVPESDATFLNMFWLEPLSVFVIVTVSVAPATVDIPVPCASVTVLPLVIVCAEPEPPVISKEVKPPGIVAQVLSPLR